MMYSTESKKNNKDMLFYVFLCVEGRSANSPSGDTCHRTFDYFVVLVSFTFYFFLFNALTLDRKEKMVISLDDFLLLMGVEFLGESLIFLVRISNFSLHLGQHCNTLTSSNHQPVNPSLLLGLWHFI